jgi:hypothetical protein
MLFPSLKANGIQLVLFGMQNRAFGPSLAAMHIFLIPAMFWKEQGLGNPELHGFLCAVCCSPSPVPQEGPATARSIRAANGTSKGHRSIQE